MRHVHVNKIRKYQIRTQNVGFIFEDDVEFGEIHLAQVKAHSLNKNNIKVDVRDLEKNKKAELRKFLHKHFPLFFGKIQAVNVGEDKICILPHAERKNHIF